MVPDGPVNIISYSWAVSRCRIVHGRVELLSVNAISLHPCPILS